MSSSRKGSAKSTAAATLRIAIAGSDGLACILAQQLAESGHAILIVSAQSYALQPFQAEPEFEENVQVATVDYSSCDELRYILQGVDLVISTVAGPDQLSLIEAAKDARVRHFVPSEFERAGAGDALAALRSCATAGGTKSSRSSSSSSPSSSSQRPHSMQYTIFSFGVLYERFAPGGLASYNMGWGEQLGGGVGSADVFQVDDQSATVDIVETDGQGRPVQLAMTSVYDVAKFVAAAVEVGLTKWPKEWKLCGDHMTVRDVVGAYSSVRGVQFNVIPYSYSQVESRLNDFQRFGDWHGWSRFERLRAMAEGSFNIRSPKANNLGVQPISFREWLQHAWGPANQAASVQEFSSDFSGSS